MRRTMDIAGTDLDPSFTDEMLDAFTRIHAPSVQVFSTFENEPKAIGFCARLWRRGQRLVAELEIDDGAYWPAPNEPQPAPLHAESVVTFRDGTTELLAVVVTSMPRGMLGGMFREALEAARETN